MSYLNRKLVKGKIYNEIRHGQDLVYTVPAARRAAIEAELALVNAFLRAHTWPEQYEGNIKSSRAGIWLACNDHGLFIQNLVTPKPWPHRFPHQALQARERSDTRKRDRAKALYAKAADIENDPARAFELNVKADEIVGKGFRLSDDKMWTTTDYFTYRTPDGPRKIRAPASINKQLATHEILLAALGAPTCVFLECVRKSPDGRLLLRYTPDLLQPDGQGV